MKRYSFVSSYMHDNMDGRWVLWNDVEKLMADNREMFDLLEEIGSEEFEPCRKSWYRRVQEITNKLRGDYVRVQSESSGVVSTTPGK